MKANPFVGQDIASLLNGLDGLIFTGGSDIGPSFYKTPEPWHGIEAEGNCDGRRDVSDYILMRWCMEKEPALPVLCICRGMQMLSVVSWITRVPFAISAPLRKRAIKRFSYFFSERSARRIESMATGTVRTSTAIITGTFSITGIIS